jgi:hypothetical protein
MEMWGSLKPTGTLHCLHGGKPILLKANRKNILTNEEGG